MNDQNRQKLPRLRCEPASRISFRGLVLISLIGGALASARIWWEHIDHALNWNRAAENLRMVGPACDFASSIWHDQDTFTTVLDRHRDWQRVLVPFRKNPQKPPLVDHPQAYVILKCSISLEDLEDDFRWLNLGRLYGSSAVFLNRQKLLQQNDNGIAEAPLPTDITDAATITIISRRDPETNSLGPATLLPMFVSDKRSELQGLDHSLWFFRIQRPVFLAATSLAILIFFSVAWIAGMRFRDVGWMIVILSAQSLRQWILYTPVGFWDRWRDDVTEVLRYATLLGFIGFTPAFLRLRKGQNVWVVTYICALLAVISLKVGMDKSTWRMYRLHQELPALLAALGMGVTAVLAHRHLKEIPTRRRRQKQFFGYVALASAGALILQTQSIRLTGFAFEIYIIYAMILLFSLFLASDLVAAHELIQQERTVRANLSDRVQLAAADRDLALQMQVGLRPPLPAQSKLLSPPDRLSGLWWCSYSFKNSAGGSRTGLSVGFFPGPAAATAQLSAMAMAYAQDQHFENVETYQLALAKSIGSIPGGSESSLCIIEFLSEGFQFLRKGPQRLMKVTGVDLAIPIDKIGSYQNKELHSRKEVGTSPLLLLFGSFPEINTQISRGISVSALTSCPSSEILMLFLGDEQLQ